MTLFKGQNLLEFVEQFKTDSDCLIYLSKIKWKEKYKCLKCGHSGSQTRDNHSKTCNRCSYIESPTANTLFHKVKFGIRKAFYIPKPNRFSDNLTNLFFLRLRQNLETYSYGEKF